MATAFYSTLVFVGEKTKATYTRQIYLTDVAGDLVRWDAGAGAGAATPDFQQFPEAVRLIDISAQTATTVKNLRLIANGNPTGHLFNFATQINTQPQRPAINILFNQGTNIRFIQTA